MKNLLTVDCLCSLAKNKLQELSDYEKNLQRRMKAYPKASLRLGKSHGLVQYFESLHGIKSRYIPKREMAYAATLAQKEFDEGQLLKVQNLISTLKSFLFLYKPNELLDDYEKLHHARKKLVNPAILPQNEFVNRWKIEQYDELNIEKESLYLTVSSGIRVRSKSEVIIAEKLISMGVPFRYECPCKMKNGACLYPDFCCLNVRTRKEILWEHFGLMDDLEYVGKMVQKIRTYLLNGYFEGDNLICSYEKNGLPMTPTYAEKLVKKYLL